VTVEHGEHGERPPFEASEHRGIESNEQPAPQAHHILLMHVQT
jgi:hypothetical protein